MKNLLAAGVALFVLAGCNNSANKVQTESATSSVPDKAIETVYDVAYVNMDSLITHYDRYIDLSAELEAKAKKVENDLTAKGRRLENDIVDYQEKINKGLVTRSQAADLEEQLQKKSQAFEENRQQAMADLQEQQQVMTNQVIYSIQQYVAEYNKDLRFKIIFSTSGSAPILHADPALNITDQILEGLNAAYVAEKAKESKK